MKFKLTIELGNDAMGTVEDIHKALRTIANELLHHEGHDEDGFVASGISGGIRDRNGNKVGRWEIS